MDVVIPTHGRAIATMQTTLKVLNWAGVTPTLVVQDDWEAHYGKMRHSSQLQFNLGVLPKNIKTISPTRDWIIHDMQGTDHMLILDDDLHFFARRDDDRGKFRQIERSDIHKMLDSMSGALVNYPIVGLGAREGGNRVTDEFVHNTRIMRAMGVRRSFMKKHHITCHPMKVMEDFHLCLQVLRSGRDTLVLNNWVTNQAGGSGAAGGCSSFRTPEVQAEAAHKLAALHPGFVRVVKKQTKTAWGGEERTDVIVSWKAARSAA